MERRAGCGRCGQAPFRELARPKVSSGMHSKFKPWMPAINVSGMNGLAPMMSAFIASLVRLPSDERHCRGERPRGPSASAAPPRASGWLFALCSPWYHNFYNISGPGCIESRFRDQRRFVGERLRRMSPDFPQRSTEPAAFDPQDVITSKQGACSGVAPKHTAFCGSRFPQAIAPRTGRLAFFFDPAIFLVVAGERSRLIC